MRCPCAATRRRLRLGAAGRFYLVLPNLGQQPRRRCDAVSLRPSQPLRRCRATAVRPTLGSRSAPAGTAFAGVVRALSRPRRNGGKADRTHQQPRNHRQHHRQPGRPSGEALSAGEAATGHGRRASRDAGQLARNNRPAPYQNGNCTASQCAAARRVDSPSCTASAKVYNVFTQSSQRAFETKLPCKPWSPASA